MTGNTLAELAAQMRAETIRLLCENPDLHNGDLEKSLCQREHPWVPALTGCRRNVVTEVRIEIRDAGLRALCAEVSADAIATVQA